MVGETIRDRSRSRRRRNKLLVAAFLVASMLTNQGCPAINPATIMYFTSLVSMIASAVSTVAQVAGEEDIASVAGDVAAVSGVVNMGASAVNGSPIFGQGPRVESGGGQQTTWKNPDEAEQTKVPPADQGGSGAPPGDQQISITKALSGAQSAIAYPLPDEPAIERTPLPAPGADEDRFTGANPFQQDYVPVENPPDRWNDKEEKANASIGTAPPREPSQAELRRRVACAERVRAEFGRARDAMIGSDEYMSLSESRQREFRRALATRLSMKLDECGRY